MKDMKLSNIQKESEKIKIKKKIHKINPNELYPNYTSY